MNEMMIYGIGALLICFTVLTFLLSRLPTNVFPENYEFKLDPFWYVSAVMLVGATAVFFLFPDLPDTVKTYHYTGILLPFVFAGVIYLCYLLDVNWLTNLLTFGAAYIISYMQPDNFQLFPAQLVPWQDKLAVAAIIFVLSKGLGLLNGIGGVASAQFCAVMVTAIILTYFGALPQFLAVIAMTYLGTMIAFAFFSWPPEKIVMSNGAFASIGFIMGCFMLDAANEFAEAPMLIAASYLVTEVLIALYNRFICHEKTDSLYMNTSYYKTSNEGIYDAGVARGILKILAIDIVLSLMQIVAYERLAIPVFAVALNLWFLSILSGDTNPEELVSLTKWGKKVVKGVFSKKKKS